MNKLMVMVALLTLSFQCFGKDIVFLHGGPGFNSFPESKILGSEFQGHKFHYWNEPSELRMNSPYSTTDAFDRALKSAEEFLDGACDTCQVTLVGHSFAVHYIVRLAETHAHKINKIILLTPGLNLKAADERIIALAVKGLEVEGRPLESAELAKLLPELSEAFDEKKIKAFSLAGLYAGLFVNYWTRPDPMMSYFSYLTGLYSFDGKALFAVRMTMPLVDQDPTHGSEIPVDVYFGDADPVSKLDDQLPLLKKYFSQLTVKLIPGTGHYLHIEKTSEVNF